MTLKEKLALASSNRTIIRYKPTIRVGRVCKQALAEIERLEAELARRVPAPENCDQRGHG